MENEKTFRIRGIKDLVQDDNISFEWKKASAKLTKILLGLGKAAILLGIFYIILAPVITMISSSFFTANDLYNPVVMLIPEEGTLDNYRTVISRMDYWKTLGRTLLYDGTLTLIQLFVCSMTGYGFARYNFPFKKVLFAMVILTIVVPSHTIMLPMYMTFRNFDIFGIIKALTGSTVNLLGTPVPMYMVTIFGQGLRSGLYIYIFNQFFRGMPKEIEEAAAVDGAGRFYTYFHVMIPCATPSIITVTVFSLVWQYNDTFFAKTFSMNSKYLISMKLSSLAPALASIDEIRDELLTQIYVYAGVIMTLIPVVILYILLQRRFIEGVERSGIVG